MKDDDDNERKREDRSNRTINTGGGSYIEGTSRVEGGDFVGRNRTDRQPPEAEFRQW